MSLKMYFILSFASALVSCYSSAQKQMGSAQEKFKVTKTDEQWRNQLSPMAYKVLREEATERAFTGKYYDFKGKGTYLCAGCATPLYESRHKFDSGTGWPSFDRAIEGNVAYGSDTKIGYERQEVHCAVCGGHLGHVFDDGPRETTGKRHCINSVALSFKAY